METKLQTKIIQWLRANGVYVLKTRVLPGVPVGCPDIIGLYRDKWLAIEVKRAPNAPFRSGQQATLQHLRKNNHFVYVVHPDNWETVRGEIAALFL